MQLSSLAQTFLLHSAHLPEVFCFAFPGKDQMELLFDEYQEISNKEQGSLPGSTTNEVSPL